MAVLTLEEYRRRSPLVEQLVQLIPGWQLERLAMRRLKKGTALIHAGLRDDTLYLLLDGVADVSREFESGLRMTYYKVTAGDLVGLYELICVSSGRIATVRAHTDLVALAIPKNMVLDWFHNQPELAMMVAGRVISRLFDANGLLAECSSYNLLRSTVTYLIHVYGLYLNQYPQGFTGAVRIAESRQEIADFLGADVRSVNRAVEKLKNSGLITIVRGKIHVDQEQYCKLLEEKNAGLLLA